MTNYELVSLCGGVMKALHENGISVDDYRWLGLYRDYLEMREKGHKVTYIVAELSKRHKVCERTVYKVVGKMSGECRISAVE